ncbi:hypothetical protein FQA39_LY14656 [Lamprigera yunnana]|nr:hypothetical protein FQA39_LY14656 [Lamprigera yunnana]
MKPRRSLPADYYKVTKTTPRLNSNIHSLTNLDNEVNNINSLFVSKDFTPYVIWRNYQNSDLQNQLQLRLLQHKKILNVYSTLQRFSASSRPLTYEEENNENEGVSVNGENFKIETTSMSKEINKYLANMVWGALKVLHKLISDETNIFADVQVDFHDTQNENKVLEITPEPKLLDISYNYVSAQDNANTVVSIAPSKPHDVETSTEANFRNEIEPQAVPDSYTTNVDDSTYVEKPF